MDDPGPRTETVPAVSAEVCSKSHESVGVVSAIVLISYGLLKYCLYTGLVMV